MVEMKLRCIDLLGRDNHPVIKSGRSILHRNA